MVSSEEDAGLVVVEGGTRDEDVGALEGLWGWGAVGGLWRRVFGLSLTLHWVSKLGALGLAPELALLRCGGLDRRRVSWMEVGDCLVYCGGTPRCSGV